MAKKLHVCTGKSCKNEGLFKKIKDWAKDLKLKNKIKKTGCLGKCKDAAAIKFKGHIYSCQSEKELEKIVVGKN